ncbi:unnamed protein product [Allacma fusca]|uniref:DUF4789 domain-containing protein n=1 Tax=Allacma fusca TaxID=39272 RepID=A0A8J2M6N9_9HEXA|nr:unnamed protein product [Allacma fusca]
MEASTILKLLFELYLVIIIAENCFCKPPKPKPLSPATNSTQKGPCSLPHEFYYNETKHCYLVDSFSQGPCGEQMTLIEEPGTPFGKCACKKPLSGVGGCEGRPLLFWPETSRCYHIFEQGPCKDNEWLVVDAKNVTMCQPNPCSSNHQQQPENNENTFTFSHNGKCYDTKTQAFCNAHEKVYFTGSSFEPICSVGARACFVSFSVSTISRLNCADGTVRDSTGGCSPLANFR